MSYIHESIRKSVGGFKDETESLFKTHGRKETKLSKKTKEKNPFISEENKKN